MLVAKVVPVAIFATVDIVLVGILLIALCLLIEFLIELFDIF